MSSSKLVVFASPELELNIVNAVSSLLNWKVTSYSTGPETNISLTNVDELTDLLTEADTCVISTHTDFNGDRNLEIQHGLALGKACKKAGVKHVIFLGHLSCEKTIGVPARHYDSKAEIYTYLRQNLELPTTMVSVPPLYEMFYDFLCPTANKWQQHEVAFPSVSTTPISFIAREDVGYCLLPIIDNPQSFMYKTVSLCGDKLTGKGVTKILNRHLPQLQFVQKQVTVEEVRQRRFQGSVDIANMFEFLGRGDLKSSPNGNKELFPHIKDFNCWVEFNKTKLLAVLKSNEIDRSAVATVI